MDVHEPGLHVRKKRKVEIYIHIYIYTHIVHVSFRTRSCTSARHWHTCRIQVHGQLSRLPRPLSGFVGCCEEAAASHACESHVPGVRARSILQFLRYPCRCRWASSPLRPVPCCKDQDGSGCCQEPAMAVTEWNLDTIIRAAETL